MADKIVILDETDKVSIEAQIKHHTSNVSNPHGVTVTQIGAADTTLSNLSNKATALSNLGVTATAEELNYVDGATSNIQAQLNAKVPTVRTINGKDLSSDISLDFSDVGAASAGTHHIQTYTDIAQIGLTAGSETIESIATALPNSSRLMYTITDINASIYPYKYGTLIVDKMNASRVTFQFYKKDSSRFWVGMYTVTDDAATWFGWSLIYGEDSKPTPEDIGAVDKTGDTMTGVLTMQKYDNGSGWIQKNHSSSADYGMQIRDVSASEQVTTLAVCGAEQKVTVTLKDGPDASAVAYDVYHKGNKPTASEITPGTFSGKMVAQYTANSDLSSGQLRNIYAGTASMTAGSTKLNPGNIYLQYE